MLWYAMLESDMWDGLILQTTKKDAELMSFSNITSLTDV